MSERKKGFWPWVALLMVIAAPVYFFTKTHFPLVHEGIVAVGGLGMSYFGLRYIYEKWD